MQSYDLTNTFFEGEARQNPKAQRGRSREKRSDCPLVTLGLVLDGSGFPRRSEIFAGNASEPQTLETMLTGLGAGANTTVVLDAGIATQDNIDYLVTQGYRYLVVSRQRKRDFDEDKATERFEAALQSMADGLHKKGTTKRHDKILERIGRLKEKYSRAAQHYEITVTPDPDSDKAGSITWTRLEKPHTQATHPGVYCLRTNLTDWDETTLWQTYTLLTDLEAVFRSLKSELGLRPIYHHKEKRVNGHILITLLAYHLVHTLRSQLKTRGINDSWPTLRAKMENQQRITVVLEREDGKTLHLRKATRAEPQQKAIYDALGIEAQPGPTLKTVV